ncbi:MAG: response regulator [Gaiellaceae bacterium]|jgi:DNA-binding NarL/FixJ family response regulator|nr:response regulator transcription factor [Acidobacteriota bacterium]
MPIRVILGEDSYLASEGIAHILERADGVELIGTHRDLDTLTAAIAAERPDVVLTDIRMPPTNSDEGIRLANTLRTSDPEIGVVVLSQHAEPAYVTSLLEGGSHGRAYLLKERVKNAGELAGAVREVAEGGSVIDPSVVEKLLESRRRHENSGLESLTPREVEILSLIAEGRSNAAIADSLVLTKRAVERHINSIFTKVDLGSPEDVSRRVRAALLYLAAHG